MWYSNFPGGSDHKEYTCNAGDLGSSPGLGSAPGEGHDNPLHYSCLENSMDTEARQATVHGLAKWAPRAQPRPYRCTYSRPAAAASSTPPRSQVYEPRPPSSCLSPKMGWSVSRGWTFLLSSRQAPFCLLDLLSLSHFPHQLLVPLSLFFFFKAFLFLSPLFSAPLNISACLSNPLSSSFLLRCAPAYRSLRDSLLSLICLCPASVLGQCLNAPLGQLSNSLIPGAFSVLFFSLVWMERSSWPGERRCYSKLNFN